MHLPTLLFTIVLPTVTLARGMFDKHNWDHDLEICVDVCNRFADGQVDYDYACNEACIQSGNEYPDPMCRKCAIACRDKHKDPKNMYYCNMCYEKGPDTKDWKKGKGGKKNA